MLVPTIASAQFGDVLKKAKDKVKSSVPANSNTPATTNGNTAPATASAPATDTGASSPAANNGASAPAAGASDIPHAPDSELLPGADGKVGHPNEHQREEGHLYSIREMRQYFDQCMADYSRCGSNYSDVMKTEASYCKVKVKFTVDDQLIRYAISQDTSVIGPVREALGAYGGGCLNERPGMSERLQANVQTIHLTGIPRGAGKMEFGGQLYSYDRATKAVTIGMTAGNMGSLGTEFSPWLSKQVAH